jgi:hypothetical protein
MYENMTLGLHSVRLSACLAPYIATARKYLCSAILSPSWTVCVVVLLTLLLSHVRSSSDDDLQIDSLSDITDIAESWASRKLLAGDDNSYAASVGRTGSIGICRRLRPSMALDRSGGMCVSFSCAWPRTLGTFIMVQGVDYRGEQVSPESGFVLRCCRGQLDRRVQRRSEGLRFYERGRMCDFVDYSDVSVLAR